MENTHRLGMPFILPSQAQKHVTHNEAIRMLDALVQPCLEALPQNDPPTTPEDGMVFAVSDNPTGDWQDKANTLAARQDGAWFHFTPQEGWRFAIKGSDDTVRHNGGIWEVAGAIDLENIPTIGINTTSDTENRIAISSNYSLFTHDGNSHQLKINKAAEIETASILFQDGFSGRAEIGLVGDDEFVFKTSADGNVFNEAIRILSATASVKTGNLGINRAPDTNLHVHTASSTATIRLQSGEGGTYGSPFADLSHDGSSFYFTNWGGGDLAFTAIRPGTSVAFGAAGNVRMRINETNVSPEQDNATSLGKANNRWSEIWSANGVIQTSDRRDKTVLGNLAQAAEILDAVEPVAYRWNAQPEGETPNAGFIAQDIAAVLETLDCDLALCGAADPDSDSNRHWIKPDQLLAVLWQALRATRNELALLRQSMAN